MSYNIMKKRAGFAGSTEGTIENIVDTHTHQTINGSKSFSNTVTSSADVMLSGSGKISASFFYGDGSGLSGVSGGAAAQGPVESIQFHTGSGGLSGSANLTFVTSSNTLEVTGDISASVNISASSFYGDGSNLTDIAAANISGQLSPTQIAHSSPLTNSGGTLDVKIVSNSGIIDSSGLKLGIDSMNVAPYNDTYFVAVSDGSDNPYKIQFSTIESSINIDGGNITGSNSINNAVLPSTINQSVISASTGISGAFFEGDGSGLTGVTASPTPAGSNTQIQFNDDGALAGDADLTFLTGSNTLATTIVSASAHVSASEFATAGGTVIDSDGNFQGNNAFFDQITASSDISSSGDIYGLNFRGNGSTLDNVPLVSSNAASVVFVDNASNKTITSNSNFTYNGSDVLNSAGGFSGSTDLQVGGHITGSGDLKLLNGDVHLNSTIYFDSSESTSDCLIRQNPDNSLTIDANNNLWLVADENIYITKNFVQKVKFDVNNDLATFNIPITSSQHISASAYATAGGTVITDEGNFQGNNASFNEITASSVISSSAEISASALKIEGKSILNDDVTIAANKRIYLDGTGVSANQGPYIYGSANTMYLDGDDNMYLYHDTRMSIFYGSSRIMDIQSGEIAFDTTISSSNYISASAYATAGGTVITDEGNFQGNNASFNEITASSVISSSAEISASSFHGDGSGLENISATPQYRYYQVRGYVATSGITYFNPHQTGGSANPVVQPNQKFAAPGDGSIVRWIITPATNTAPTPGQSIKTFFLKNSNSLASSGEATAHVTGTVDLALNISGIGNTSGSIVDWTGTNLTVSGSNSFSAGDQLLFGLGPDTNMGDCSVAVILKIDESITYG